MYRKFECRKDIRYKIQRTQVRFPALEGLGVAFFATGPGSDLITYIFTTLEFPIHNFEFHLLTTSAKYYYLYIILPGSETKSTWKRLDKMKKKLHALKILG